MKNLKYFKEDYNSNLIQNLGMLNEIIYKKYSEEYKILMDLSLWISFCDDTFEKLKKSEKVDFACGLVGHNYSQIFKSTNLSNEMKEIFCKLRSLGIEECKLNLLLSEMNRYVFALVDEDNLLTSQQIYYCNYIETGKCTVGFNIILFLIAILSEKGAGFYERHTYVSLVANNASRALRVANDFADYEVERYFDIINVGSRGSCLEVRDFYKMSLFYLNKTKIIIEYFLEGQEYAKPVSKYLDVAVGAYLKSGNIRNKEIHV